MPDFFLKPVYFSNLLKGQPASLVGQSQNILGGLVTQSLLT
jgi:hypothetical protein